jgi:hypothetical protein
VMFAASTIDQSGGATATSPRRVALFIRCSPALGERRERGAGTMRR